MRIKVYPYKSGSRSAKTLAEALGGKVLKTVGSKYRPRKGDVVINWGASGVPDFGPAVILNNDVTVAQCKLSTLKILNESGVVVPPFAYPPINMAKVEAAKEAAEQWGYPVVCRTKLRGHSGDGIVIANNVDELVDAPLYTKYIKKKDEYRVHVFRGKAFFIQRKARKLDVEEPNWQVRNLQGGFVFVEVGVDDVPDDVIHQANRSVEALGLDFGGADILWNEREERAYAIEVNTAVGIEERTAERYKAEILDFIARN